MNASGLICLSLALGASPQQSPGAPSDAAALAEAAGWIHQLTRETARYDYMMSVKIRLLVFWISRDEVGGGYIRTLEAPDDPQLHSIDVLFGSDPAKTKGINRWGAGTEIVRAPSGEAESASSAFLGFMKASQGDSASSMQAELKREKEQGIFVFNATLTRVDKGRALARTTPFDSKEDYNFRQLESATRTVRDRLDQTDRPIQRANPADGACDRPASFLSSVKALIDDAVTGRPAPRALCYYFNARPYTVTLKSWKQVGEATTHRPAIAYRNLVRAEFVVLNMHDHKTSTFELLVPREGRWQGIPIEIVHQPNWWFQVVLSLKP